MTGHELRRARQSLGLTKACLGQMIGASVDLLERMEQGLADVPVELSDWVWGLIRWSNSHPAPQFDEPRLEMPPLPEPPQPPKEPKPPKLPRRVKVKAAPSDRPLSIEDAIKKTNFATRMRRARAGLKSGLV